MTKAEFVYDLLKEAKVKLDFKPNDYKIKIRNNFVVINYLLLKNHKKLIVSVLGKKVVEKKMRNSNPRWEEENV